ncbi:hypothetical protein ZWY2020_036696 [Hordeum vulgare]|nr:hypothetical protein ZWY2020_036696 [Hordeum vulgare]
MAPPHPPPCRPLTPVDKRIATIQNCWVAGVQNSSRDLASVLRVPSAICCRPPQGPTNGVLVVPAPTPVPDLVVLGSAPMPSTEPTLLGTPLGMGFFLTPFQGFSPIGVPSSSTFDVAMSTGSMSPVVARAGSSSALPPLSFPPGF